ncbi:MAG: MauE/DoxX family redox-associated membrane protein [Actinomycetota bacterium]
MISWLILVVATLAAGLLAAAGCIKLARPLPTARAMYAAGLPGPVWAVRGLGLAEVVVGVWFLVAPSAPLAVALGSTYLVFAAFVAYLVAAHPEAASCGCAGSKDVPPSRLHAAMNLFAAVGSFASLIRPPTGMGATLTNLGPASLPFALGLAVAAALAVVATTDLPPALAAYRRPQGHPVEADHDRHARADTALASVGVGALHPSLWPGIDPDELRAAAAPVEDARG